MRTFLPITRAALAFAAITASATPPAGTNAAPPARCEIRLSAWCIAEGAHEVTRQLADDRIHDRVWTLRGRFRPESTVVIFEPNGCKAGYSDVTELKAVDPGVEWRGRAWHRLHVALKSDGTCTLSILLPPDEGDSMEWAFTSGLPLVRACKDDACEGEGLGQLKSRLAVHFRTDEVANP